MEPQTQKLAIGVLYPHQLSLTYMSRCSSLCVDSMDIAEWIMTQLLSIVVTTIINYHFGNGLDDPFLLKYGDGKILGLPHFLSFSLFFFIHSLSTRPSRQVTARINIKLITVSQSASGSEVLDRDLLEVMGYPSLHIFTMRG